VETELDERLLLVHVELPEDLRSVEQVLVLEDLLRVPGQEGQVKDERHPVAVDQEQEGQESVDTGLGDDVHVQAVAEIDRVDIVAFQVRVHDREEHLQEEVDCIEQDREEEQPSFSGHFGGICGVMVGG